MDKPYTSIASVTIILFNMMYSATLNTEMFVYIDFTKTLSRFNLSDQIESDNE